MEELTTKKNGLVYTEDLKTVVGIDSESTEFTGNVPNGVTAVGEEAFSCCNLTRISLPDSVTEVGASLFCNSTELTSVRLPANLKTLSPFMFCGCKSLTEIEMPDEVDDFPEGLFAECSSLTEIPFRGGIKILPEGVIDSCTSIKTLVIPDTVTKICAGAIVNCTSLETLVLPAELEELEEGWLKDCPNLRHIRISDENYKFRTDDDSRILYRLSGSSEIVEIELEKLSDDSLPGFKDPDTESSIISFDESEDMTMDEPVFLSDAEKSLMGEDTVADEPAVGFAAEEMGITEEQPVAEEPAAEEGMDARLAEILGQNKMYDEGEFSIMDIPQASDDEIAADMLSSSAPVEDKFVNEEPVQVTVHETVEETPEDMEAKLKEIMGQNTDTFSINDIPMASEEEINANKVLDSTSVDETMSDPFAPVDGADEVSIPTGETVSEEFVDQEQSEDFGGIEAMVSDEGGEDDVPAPVQTEVNEDKAFMNNLCFETNKVEQQNIPQSGAKTRMLFVFAENLVETELGKKFSVKLQNCCQRLAKIHKFTSVYYFNDTRMDNDKFREQLKNFMADKDVLIACEGDDLYSISDRTRTMADCLGVSLDSESIKAEISMASDATVSPLKLIVSDILEE